MLFAAMINNLLIFIDFMAVNARKKSQKEVLAQFRRLITFARTV